MKEPAIGRSTRRRAGLVGLGFAISYLFGQSALASLPLAPTGDPTGPEVARYLSQNAAAVRLLNLVVALSTILLIWFGYSLQQVMGSMARRSTRAGRLPGPSSVAAATVLLFATALGPMLGYESLSPAEAKTFWEVNITLSVLFVIPLAIFTAGVAIGSRGLDVPRWVRATAFPLIPILLFIFLAWLSIKLWCLWVAAVGISLLRGRRWGASTRP
ncbi:MAG: hypothetical protein ACLGIB_10420 [Actinomycetota bacterium]